MRSALAILLLASTTCAAFASDNGPPSAPNSPQCLQENILITLVSDPREGIETREFAMEIRNGTAISLGAVLASFDIYATGRPLPLGRYYLPTTQNIPGALLPGETMTVTAYHFLDDRAVDLARAADGLSVEIIIENAADDQIRPLLPPPHPNPWSEPPSTARCTALESMP